MPDSYRAVSLGATAASPERSTDDSEKRAGDKGSTNMAVDFETLLAERDAERDPHIFAKGQEEEREWMKKALAAFAAGQLSMQSFQMLVDNPAARSGFDFSSATPQDIVPCPIRTEQ